MSRGSGPVRQVDLHGMPPEAALQRLGQELHAARVAGKKSLLAITGRGWGNREQKPVLRLRVEAWLAAEGKRRFGVVGFRRVSKGGALEIDLA